MIAGENARRSGLAVAACGNAELRVLVLPKMWQGSSRSLSEGPTYASETLGNGKVAISVVCHEGDEFALRSASLPDAEWGDVRECCGVIADRAQRLAAITKGKRKGRHRSALVRRSAKTQLDEPKREVGPESRMRNEWRQFLCLWNRIPDDLRRYRTPLGLFGDVSVLEAMESLLAPLLKRAYVQAVGRTIHHARPGYTRATCSSKFIRGSMDVASAAIAMRGGRDTVVCTYDVFGLDTTLLRVIASALRVVAAGDAAGDLPTAPETISDARWLLGKLAAVQQLPRVSAARLGRALLTRLSRLDSEWDQALRLACIVLDASGIEPMTGPDEGSLGWHDEQAPCYVFDVNTASLWEWMVREAWPAATTCEKGEPRFAWEHEHGQRGMQVDVMAGNVIADAKYRAWEPDPPSAEKRQAFAYSHLYKAVSVFWVYAEPCGSFCKSGKPRLRTKYSGASSGASCSLGPETLRAIAAAFPAPMDVEDDATWAKYLDRLKTQLGDACNGKCP